MFHQTIGTMGHKKKLSLALSSILLIAILTLSLVTFFSCASAISQREDLVRNTYHEILNEDPSKIAMSHWIKELKGGMTQEEFSANLKKMKSLSKQINSDCPEKFKNQPKKKGLGKFRAKKVIGRHFDRYLFRSPNASEERMYANRLVNGKSKQWLQKNLKKTVEYKEKWAPLNKDTLETINQLYQKTIGKPPSRMESQKYGYLLQHKEMSQNQIKQELMELQNNSPKS